MQMHLRWLSSAQYDEGIFSTGIPYVQPLIDRHYQRAASRISISRVRADTGWNWAAILLLAKTQSLAHLAPGGQYSQTSTAAIGLQGVPVGLMTYVRKFDCRLDGSNHRVTLVWHAASAPVEFYESMGFAQPSGVMLALLGSAVQSGVIGSNSDGLLLRAAPGGGQALRNFYSERCGMTALGWNREPISPLRRSNHDDYFWLDKASAQHFSNQFDDLR